MAGQVSSSHFRIFFGFLPAGVSSRLLDGVARGVQVLAHGADGQADAALLSDQIAHGAAAPEGRGDAQFVGAVIAISRFRNGYHDRDRPFKAVNAVSHALGCVGFRVGNRGDATSIDSRVQSAP